MEADKSALKTSLDARYEYKTKEDNIVSMSRFELGKFWFSASARGLDNVHIYMWLLKDLSWTLDSFWMSAIFGSLAIAWSVVLMATAYRSQDWEEMYMLVATVLWLFGNFWWMTAETGVLGDDDEHSLQSSYMLDTAVVWLAIFYCIAPVRHHPRESFCHGAVSSLGPATPLPLLFQKLRQYEYMHMLLGHQGPELESPVPPHMIIGSSSRFC